MNSYDQNLEKNGIKQKNRFLASDDGSLADFKCHRVSKEQFDKRMPGLFKPEFIGDGMVCLNLKAVHAWERTDNKTSCKGTNKRQNIFSRDHFLSVLMTQIPGQVVNSGFIKDGLMIKTYTQSKQGLAFFYAKRKVLLDGIRTVHLNI